MDQIIMLMLLFALMVGSWAVNRQNLRKGRLVKRPVPVERDPLEKRKKQ